MYLSEVFVLSVLFFLGCLGVPIDISSDVVDTFPTGGVSSPMEEVFVEELSLLIQAIKHWN